MEESLSFNTIISFMTNTNLQDYSGEAGLSHFSQMTVINGTTLGINRIIFNFKGYKY